MHKNGLSLNSNDENTLFNLGYICFTLGEYNNSLMYLTKISNRDEEINELIKRAKENIQF